MDIFSFLSINTRNNAYNENTSNNEVIKVLEPDWDNFFNKPLEKTIDHRTIYKEALNTGPVYTCYHLESYMMKIVARNFVKKAFRIICPKCSIKSPLDFGLKELIIEFTKIIDYDFKYAVFARGMEQACKIMTLHDLNKVEENELLEEFIQKFKTKHKVEDILNDFFWILDKLDAYDILEKFRFGPQNFAYKIIRPSKNINHVDVQYLMQQLLNLYQTFHKIKKACKKNYLSSINSLF